MTVNKCTFEGCHDIDRGGGLCWMHYRRKRFGKDMSAPKRSYKRKKVIPLGGHFVGEIINGKQLVEYAGQNNLGQHQWFWICGTCSNKYGPANVGHLKRSSRCRDCAMRRENNPRWLGYEQISGSFLWQYRDGAERRGLVWDVTPVQLWAKWTEQGGRCVYTGWDLVHGVDASIDRIDSSKGYVLENIQWVHRDINIMKLDHPEAYFITLCQAVVARKELDGRSGGEIQTFQRTSQDPPRPVLAERAAT